MSKNQELAFYPRGYTGEKWVHEKKCVVPLATRETQRKTTARCCFCYLVAQSYLTLCDSVDCSLPGSSVHGISQARILECVVISFSSRSSQPRIQLESPASQIDFLPSVPPGKPTVRYYYLPIRTVQMKNSHKVFPGGPVVEDLSSNAGDSGSIPGLGTKIIHATGQLSLHTTAREAHTLQPRPSAAKKKKKIVTTLRKTSVSSN